MIYRLIYKSKLIGAMNFRLLVDLMDQSEKKNEAMGITGFLLATDEEFLQVLEGSFEAVNELYHTIVQDQRHTHVQLIGFDVVADRAFPEWTMKGSSINELKQPLRNMLLKRFGSKDGKFLLPLDKYESYALLRDAADIFKGL